jgi:hypothetical protein
MAYLSLTGRARRADPAKGTGSKKPHSAKECGFVSEASRRAAQAMAATKFFSAASQSTMFQKAAM